MAPLARSVVREILHLSVTPRMGGWLAALLVGISVGYPLTAHSPGATDAGPVLPSPLEPSVPLQEWTVDAGPVFASVSVLLNGLPAPGPNQIRRAEFCEMPARPLGGGCWLPIADETPPCDPAPGKQRKLWPYEERCWFPVSQAKPTPTSGESRPAAFANP